MKKLAPTLRWALVLIVSMNLMIDTFTIPIASATQVAFAQPTSDNPERGRDSNGPDSPSLRSHTPPRRIAMNAAHSGKSRTTSGRNPGKLTFIENKGQFDGKVKYQASHAGRTLWLTENGIVFDFLRDKPGPTKSASSEQRGFASNLGDPGLMDTRNLQKPTTREMVRSVIQQTFVGANNRSAIETRGVQNGVRNYLSGNDPAKWQTQVRAFSEIVYRDVWKGIDLRLYGKGADLEQEFIVNPGADASQIQVAYTGIDELKIARDGSLLIRSAAGRMRETQPRMYQEISGRRVSVRGRFKLPSAASYTFEVGDVNPKYALVIDPTLLYSTYLGGSAGITPLGNCSDINVGVDCPQEGATGIAVDTLGNAYIVGFTASADFPVTPGAFQTADDGTQDTFVTKLNPTGTVLVYSTYLSASFPTQIAIDRLGNAYVAGWGTHAGFATTPNAFSQSCSAPGGLPFLSVLNATGTGLLYSTCFGSFIPNVGGVPTVTSMTADADGHVYLGGLAGSSLPTTPNAYQTSPPGSVQSGFVMEFDTNLSGPASLVYSTFLGAPRATDVNAVAVDSFGKIYVAGDTDAGFPVTTGAFQTVFPPCVPNGILCPASSASYVAKFDPSASGQQSLIYATYFGGMGGTVANAIAVDSSGAAYITGYTSGSYYQSFPFTPGAFRTTVGADTHASFVTKLNPAGSQLVYSTLLGNSSSGNSIVLDSLGEAYVAGNFRGNTTFPTTPDAFQNTYTKLDSSFAEAFLTKLNPNGTALTYSSYLGGEGSDVATALAIDQTGDAYIVGNTSSGLFPITLNSFQKGLGGTGDAFVSKFPLGASPTLSISSISPSSGGNVGTVTGRILGAGFHVGASVTLTGATTITATSSVGTEGRTIDVTFDLTRAPAGSYELTVVNPDGTSIVSPNAFFVENGGGPQLAVNVVMPATFAINRGPTVFNVQVQNTGNVDAYEVMLALYGIPGDAMLKPLFTISAPTALLGGQAVDFTGAPFATVVGQQQIPLLLLSKIPAHNATALNFSLALTAVPPLPPLMPTPPGGFGGGGAGNLRIVGVGFQFPCDNTALGCWQTLLGTITTLVESLGPVGNVLSFQACLQDVLCLKLKGVKAGGLQNVTNLNELLVQLALDCVGAIPLGKVVGLAIGMASTVIGLLNCLPSQLLVGGMAESTAGFNYDPNDKEGPQGVTASRWVQPHQLLYGVYFSNEVAATAAAANVLVTDPIDPSIDLSSVSLSGLAVAGNVIPLPSNFLPALGHNQASTAIDFRPALSLVINVNISLDPISRTLSVQFASVDPTTGLPPSNPIVGVLPPGAEGSVTYSAMPSKSATTGTKISNQATIVFDTNPPMTTQTWLNTIDNTAPVSQVAALPPSEPDSGFNVTWSGTDVGSGIRDFSVFVSDNGGPFTPFQTNTTATSAKFVGQVGHTYSFYSIARDLVGNVEEAKTTAEATTLVATDTTPPVTIASASPGPNANGWNNTNVIITLNSTDSESGGTGVKQISYSAAGAQPISSTIVPTAATSFTISTEGITTITFFGTDNAGNIEMPKAITIKLDKTPPTISSSRTPGPNANGWNNTSVTLSFQCADSLSGLAAGSPPAPTTLSSEGAAQSITGTCSDLAGNSASATVTGINIDETPPTVACSASPNVLWPPNNKLVPVNLSVSVADAFSGPAGFTLVSVTSNEPDSRQGDIQGFVTGTASTTGQLRAQRLGSGTGRVYTFAYSGSDKAGNTASCTTTATVPHDQAKN